MSLGNKLELDSTRLIRLMVLESKGSQVTADRLLFLPAMNSGTRMVNYRV